MSKQLHGCLSNGARSEVERYVVWPGRTLGYKIGMLEIQRLRGAPLQLLEARITRWVES